MQVQTPPAQRPKKDRSKRDLRTLVSTRNGAMAVAAISALIAGVVLLVFLNQYKDSLNGSDKPATVLVAQRLIEKGSSGDVIATQGLYQTTRIPKGQLKEGALSDPSVLRGKAAAHDILPGQQLTTADFGASTDPILQNLAGNQRAISVPVDNAHGMIGDIHAGDRVDVIAGFNWQPNGMATATPVTKVLLQNVLVLRAPSGGARSSGPGGSDKSVVLEVPDGKTGEIAFSSDNGKVWIVKRPKAGAKDTSQGIVSTETVLFGVKPIRTDSIQKTISAEIGKALKKAAKGK
ncbi:MAG TPA: Flp pilus assembly protein CpaB [Thermoleophilaceae bacterium]